MTNLGSLMMVAALGLIANAPVMPAYTVAAPASRRATTRITTTADYSGIASHTYPTGPGWTNRHVKRMATKRRNKARHKAACKGR